MAVSTFESLDVGSTFSTPARELSDHDARALTGLGGYTHPLFTDASYAAASPFGRSPLPGQALLLLMGGLVEQSGVFDETVIALVGLDRVRFRAPAFPGDTVQVEVTVVDKQPKPDGHRGLLIMSWTCLNSSGDTLVEAEASMLLRTDTEATT